MGSRRHHLPTGPDPSTIDGRRVRAALVSLLAVGALGATGCGGDTGNPLNPPWRTDPPSTDVMVIEGRPLRRGRRGRLHVARSTTGPLRVTDAATLALDPSDRALLAAHWRRAGEMEHASVVAFCDLARRLRRLGAPADLVERCEAAAAQEAEHALRCFALASRFAGRDIGPGRLRRPRRLPHRRVHRLTTIAVDCWRDGVVNEACAAWSAAEQARLATDAEAREALLVIARDEAEHAALSADVMAWCVAVGGDPVTAALCSAAAADTARRRSPAVPDSAALAAHGVSAPLADADLADRLRSALHAA